MRPYSVFVVEDVPLTRQRPSQLLETPALRAPCAAVSRRFLPVVQHVVDSQLGRSPNAGATIRNGSN
jgi:hypothetical protein